MRTQRFTRRLIVSLALLGLLASHPATLFAASPKVADIGLAAGGTLRGQVINEQGVGQAKIEVAIARGNDVVAKTTTSSDGMFAHTGLDGGVYVVSTDGVQAVVRAWAPRTAPPAAATGLLLVPGAQTIRGQGPLMNAWQTWGVGGVIVAAAATTIITTSISNDNDDAS